MRYPACLRTAAAVFLQLAVLQSQVLAAAPGSVEQRRFTVEDSIGIANFVYSGSQYLPAPRALFSPDGAHFIAVTKRGNLRTGKREATVWLFDTAAVRKYMHTSSAGTFAGARLLLEFASASNREPLSELRWSTDSKSLLFLGADADGVERLFTVAIQSGTLKPLSRPDQDVSRYDERNGSVVYLAHAPIRASDSYQAGGSALPDKVVGPGNSVLELVFPNWMNAEFHSSEDELWRVDGEQPVVVFSGDGRTPIRLKDSRLILSADGRHVLVTPLVRHIPKSWERYVPSFDYPGMRIVADTPETEGSTGYFRAKEYAAVDLASGTMSLLVEAPIDYDGSLYNQALAQWSTTGSRIALSSIYPPLTSPLAAAAGDTILPCELAALTVATAEFSCLRQSIAIPLDSPSRHERKELVGLKWRDGDNELVAQYVTAKEPNRKLTTIFKQKNGAWTAHDVAEMRQDELVVDVREGLDEPPVLVASSKGGGSRALLDPNPQLQSIAFGHAAPYRWTDAEGNAWSGALVTPPDFSSSRRYPLVIQTHGLDPARFLVDGPSATGFAARALAARDMVVLQVQEINKNLGTPKEYETGAAGYRAAIHQLAREGIVDPAKVGIITWSHFGPHAMQGLIDDPHAYAAATWAEAGYDSYGEYLVNIDYMGPERERYFRAQLGAKPFGAGLKTVLENSPGFHTDQVCTPILFQINSPPALVFGWDTYAALRAQNKPVDFLYLRNGDHVLVKPDERLVEQGMNVDWYDYWLNGHEDPDPAKAEQYRRWSRLKSMPRCGDPP